MDANKAQFIIDVYTMKAYIHHTVSQSVNQLVSHHIETDIHMHRRTMQSASRCLSPAVDHVQKAQTDDDRAYY